MRAGVVIGGLGLALAGATAVGGCEAVLGVHDIPELEVDAGGAGSSSAAGDSGARDATGEEASGGDANSNGDADASASEGAASDAAGDGATDEAAALPSAPRPLAPLSTSRVTSRIPTLRWELPAGVASVTLELCHDRACTNPIGTPLTVDGTTFRPTTDLPIGVVYWRVSASNATSPTWQFIVGLGSASVDSSSGTTLDVNGDGYADVVVGDAKHAYVYLGGAGGLATTPATTLSAPIANTDFGTSVAGAGDVNGDGYADLVVGAPAFPSGPGHAFVYLGGAGGLAASPASTLAAPGSTTNDLFGSSVASAGDVNGDGYADVIVGARGAESAYIFWGGAPGLATTPATTLASRDGYLPDGGPGGGGFGAAVAGAGDVNGDGYGDVIVSAPTADLLAGRAYVYLGGAAGTNGTPVTTLVSPGGANTSFGTSVAGAGDVNADGYSDVIVGGDGLSGALGSAYVFLGGASAVATSPNASLRTATGVTAQFGFSVASAGDVNGDGYGDVVVGAMDVSSSAGSAFVYLGQLQGLSLSTLPAYALPGLDGPNAQFGVSVASAGDVDGDGFADLVIGANQAATDTGHVYSFRGAKTGLATTDAGVVPSTTLVGPAGENGDFGSSVFGGT